MQIIIDRKMPEQAKETLASFGEIIDLATSGITYEAISGHPDIFFFMSSSLLIASPNLPAEYFRTLDEKKVRYIKGDSPVGVKYPETARYNASGSQSYLIHRLDITEKRILDYSGEKQTIHVNQGYCRCSLLPLKTDSFITSDVGIYKKLKETGLEVLHVSSESVVLPGLKHGFIGGACGVMDNTVFLCGSLSYHPQGGEIRSFLNKNGYKILELYDGPLFDAGSILFLEE